MARSLFSVATDSAENNQSVFPFHTVLTTECQDVTVDSSSITLTAVEDEVAFDDDEQDFFQCGKCKEAFTSFSAFLLHKKEHNADRGKEYTEVSHVDELQDQSANLVFTESDIISLGIDESALDITDGQSMVLDSCTEIALLSNGSNQTCDLPTISSEEVTIATSVTNDEVLDECTNIGSNDDSDQTCNLPTVSAEEVTVATSATQSNDLKCVCCGKSFKSKFDLQQHVRSHTGEKPYQCVVCGRAFAQKSAVKKHIVTHKVWPKHLQYLTLPSLALPKECLTLPKDAKESNSSQASDEDFSDVINYSTEDTDSANAVDEPDNSNCSDAMYCSYSCQFCSEIFDSYLKWKNHFIKHKNEKVFRCIQANCNAMFKELEEYVMHSNSHELESESIYNCHVCNKVFTSLDSIGEHQYTHSLPTQVVSKRVTCKICKSKFKNVESLKRHQEMDNHKYTCPRCNREFKTQRYLRQHLQVHSSASEFTCPYCLRSFKKKIYLNTHLRIHTDVKSYTCPHCPSSFNRRDLLTRHLLNHENTKKFKCPFKHVHNCDREFNRSDKLKAHILTHCSKKIHKCAKCKKCFLKPSQHKEHQKICTGGDLNVICPVSDNDVEDSNQESNEASTIEVFVLSSKRPETRKPKRIKTVK